MNKKKLNRIGEVSISRITENDRYMIHIIRKNWKKIVGDVIAEYSFPSFFSKGKLTVIVENNLIMSEMKMYRETILENVNEEFHGTAVSEIYIKGGKIHNNRDIYNEHKETEETAEITAEEKEKIERLFPDVENNELAERIKNIALNSKINEKILLKKGFFFEVPINHLYLDFLHRTSREVLQLLLAKTVNTFHSLLLYEYCFQCYLSSQIPHGYDDTSNSHLQR